MGRSELVMAVEFAGDRGQQAEAKRLWRSWERPLHQGYPSYDDVWPDFAADLRPRCAQQSGARLVPEASACELTYANPFRPDEDLSWSSRLERMLLRSTRIDQVEHLLPKPDDARASTRFPITSPDGAPAGHLSVTIESVWVETVEPLVVMTLTAQGPPLGPGLGGIKAFFDNGFEWVVRGFAAMTAPGAGQMS